MNIFKKLGLGVFVLLLALTVSVPTTQAEAGDAICAPCRDTDLNCSCSDNPENTDPTLTEQIALLLEQVANLQAQLEELQGKQSDLRTDLRETTTLTRNLSLGLTGEDVRKIQELLAGTEFYPESIVTGYFGPLTERAVKRVQSRFGIDQVGNVGPITRGTLNQLFENKGKGKFNSFVVPAGGGLPEAVSVYLCHDGKQLVVAGPAIQEHVRLHGDTIGGCLPIFGDSGPIDEATSASAKRAIEKAEDFIKMAKDAIEEAESHGRDIVGAEALFVDAEESLEKAREELREEDFDDVVELADKAIELAVKAKESAEEGASIPDDPVGSIEESQIVSLDEEFKLQEGQSAVLTSDKDYRIKITGFINSGCPEGAQCIWSGIGIAFEHTYNGEVIKGINQFRAFGYRTTLLGTDYKTYAKLKIIKDGGGDSGPGDGENLIFGTLLKGYYNGHDDRKDYVIKETSEWSNLWDIVVTWLPKPDFPGIDFRDEMIVAVFQGNFSTGGYGVKITKIIENENFVEIFVEEISPSGGDPVTAAFSQPYHIVKMKRVDKEVIFRR